MWNVTSADQIPTLSQIINDGQTTLPLLFVGTDVDSATQLEVYEWYHDRQLCDDNVDKFVRYFNRKVRALSEQYHQYLRVETTSFDPAVTRYLERELTGDRKANVTNGAALRTETTGETTGRGEIIQEGNDTSTLTGSSTQNKDTSGTSEVSGTSNDTRTDNTTQTSNGDTSSRVNSQTGVNGLVTESIDENTSNTQRTEGKETTEQGNTALSGQLPQSSIYPNTGTSAIREVPNLSWQYNATQQDGSYNQGEKNTNETTDGSASREGNNRTTTDSTTETTGTQSTDSNNTTRNTGTVANVGKTTQDGKTTGTEMVTGSKQDTAVAETSATAKDETEGTTHTVTVTSNDGSTATDDFTKTRERYTGRDEAAQDLLNRARDYILKTNAFEWLVARLDVCFMGVYDTNFN